MLSCGFFNFLSVGWVRDRGGGEKSEKLNPIIVYIMLTLALSHLSIFFTVIIHSGPELMYAFLRLTF